MADPIIINKDSVQEMLLKVRPIIFQLALN